jgi:predicted TPR repeat methyltransferase
MTAPLVSVLSSGDLIADRRYQWALDRLARGDLVGAADILMQAIELAPEFAAAWFALGTILDRQGDRRGAIAAFERARDYDPQDTRGARLHLARLGVGEVTPQMTQAYVQRLFDQEASRFDQSLLDHLAYRAPQLLLAAITRLSGSPLHIDSMLDLGCGTGLAGTAFRPHIGWLVGVDLSAGMVAETRNKNLYDRLEVGELQRILAQHAAAGATYDLVLAADVLVYVGDLAEVATAVARVLAPRGLFALTVETHAGDGVVLQPTLRYAHDDAHVRQAFASANLKLCVLDPVSTRTENNAWVPGLLAIAARE